MSKYLLVVQAKDGCDYSIKCGLNAIEFEADSPQQAMKKAITMILGDDEISGYHGDNKLQSAILYHIANSIDLEVKEMYADYQRGIEYRKSKIDKQKRRALYDELRKEFEG